MAAHAVAFSAPAKFAPAGPLGTNDYHAVLPSGRLVKPVGISVVVGMNPLGVALSVDGRYAIVTNDDERESSATNGLDTRVVGGYTLAGLCILATGFTTSVWQAETLLCLGFLVNDLTVPIIWAVCVDVGGRYAGTVSGLMNMIGGFGAALSPFLLPRVYERLHAHYDNLLCWRFIFAGLAVSWLLGAMCWIFIDASKPLFPEESVAHRS